MMGISGDRQDSMMRRQGRKIIHTCAIALASALAISLVWFVRWEIPYEYHSAGGWWAIFVTANIGAAVGYALGRFHRASRRAWIALAASLFLSAIFAVPQFFVLIDWPSWPMGIYACVFGWPAARSNEPLTKMLLGYCFFVPLSCMAAMVILLIPFSLLSRQIGARRMVHIFLFGVSILWALTLLLYCILEIVCRAVMPLRCIVAELALATGFLTPFALAYCIIGVMLIRSAEAYTSTQ
ncbi:MAG: hypothetical protein AB1696_11005 [Planctomycetota bacterium]